MLNLIPLLLALLPTAAVLSALAAWICWRKRDRLRSPLSFKVINQAGEHLHPGLPCC